MGRARLGAVSGVIAGLLVFASAAAAGPRVESIDPSHVTAQKPVSDVVLAPRTTRRTLGAITQTFTDEHGHPITLSTDPPGVNLSVFAAVLGGTIHGDEITQLRIEVVSLAQTGATCGNVDAVACYMPDDPARSAAGQMWFAADDPDVIHTIVHEYGHHMDNQLLNLNSLGLCDYSSDGSRDWFFERDLHDDIVGEGFGCRSETWELLLPELFAEDFVVLNGIDAWMLPSAPPPTQGQLDALAYDIDNPFVPERHRWRLRVREQRMRLRTVTLDHWTFAIIKLTSPRRRDFDLLVYEHGRRRPFASSRRSGRVDRVQRILAPGVYEIGIWGHRGTGRAKVRAWLD